MNTYKLLIFDFDGTLIDSREDIADAVNEVLISMDIPVLSVDTVTDNIGHGVIHLLKNCLGLSDEKELREKYYPIFQVAYGKRLTKKTKCYPGVPEFLKSHPSLPKGILTHKPKKFTEGILQELEIRDSFPFVLSGDELTQKKPQPEGVLRLMEQAKAKPSETLFMGDSPVDIQAGKAAGVVTVGASYGFRPRKELAVLEPDYLVSSFQEFYKILQNQ